MDRTERFSVVGGNGKTDVRRSEFIGEKSLASKTRFMRLNALRISISLALSRSATAEAVSVQSPAGVKKKIFSRIMSSR